MGLKAALSVIFQALPRTYKWQKWAGSQKRDVFINPAFVCDRSLCLKRTGQSQVLPLLCLFDRVLGCSFSDTREGFIQNNGSHLRRGVRSITVRRQHNQTYFSVPVKQIKHHLHVCYWKMSASSSRWIINSLSKPPLQEIQNFFCCLAQSFNHAKEFRSRKNEKNVWCALLSKKDILFHFNFLYIKCKFMIISLIILRTIFFLLIPPLMWY